MADLEEADNQNPYTPLLDHQETQKSLKMKSRNVLIVTGILIVLGLIINFRSDHQISPRLETEKSVIIPETAVVSRGVSHGVSEKASRLFSSDGVYPWTNAMLSWQRTAFHFQPEQNWMNDPNVLQCLRQPHSQDFLMVAPVEGLGLTMNPRQYRALLGYRFGIPMFIGHTICPSCGKDKMDEHGDHAVHCANDIGVKFRHNAVRDTVFDICLNTSITVKKEVELGFLTENGQGLKPADILLYSWDQGRNTCVDITGTSPFAGNGLRSFTPGRSLEDAEIKKKKKYNDKCSGNGYCFAPFAFSTFGELSEGAIDITKRIVGIAKGNGVAAKRANQIFNRIGFSIQKGVGAQLLARLPSNFM